MTEDARKDARGNTNGEISITLATPEETARVRIAIKDPDRVAENVVSHLAKAFPPESVMTISGGRAGDLDSLDTTNTGDETATPPQTNSSSRNTSSSSPSTKPRPTKQRPKNRRSKDQYSDSTDTDCSSNSRLETISEGCPYSEDEDDEESHRHTRRTRRPRAATASGRRSARHCTEDLGSECLGKRRAATAQRLSPLRTGSRKKAQQGDNRHHQSPAFAVYKTQEYFKPRDLDFAVPITRRQGSVKLRNGSKIAIDPSRCFVVEYDTRGLPAGWRSSSPGSTTALGAACGPWAPSDLGGVCVKLQEYVKHRDLMYAVPVTTGQREISVSDGGSITVGNEDIITVFYDHLGRAGFSLQGRARKVCPGLTCIPSGEDAGVARSVRYFQLLDCEDESGEQYVIPLDGFQTRFANPFHGGEDEPSTLPVDRNNLTVVFYGKHGLPLYTQLADGSLLAGGLTGHSGADGESEFFSSLSSEGSVARVRLRSTELGFECVGVGGARATSKAISKEQASVITPHSVASSGRREIIERRVPVQRVQFIEKKIEVPEVHIVEKLVEVEKIEYQTKIVKKRQVVERPVEHVKYVPKIETKIVERIIEVPQIIEVPRPEIIENKISVDRFVDCKQEIIVSKRLTAEIQDSTGQACEEIDCLRLEPEVIAVDVFVPKVVHGKLLAMGKGQTSTREVDVPLSHYNSLVLKMNPQHATNYERLPLIKTSKGSFPLMPADAKITVPDPTDEEIFEFLKATGLVTATVADRFENASQRNS